MTSFWIYAGVLCAVAVAILVLPLLSQRRRSGRWSVLGLASSFAIAPVAVLVYTQLSTWNPEVEHRAAEGARLVDELATRLVREPDDVEGWLLLARSDMVLGQYDKGRDAYHEAWIRTPEPDNELKIAYAESQILADHAALGGEAGRLIEEVLAVDASDPKALWYGGHVAIELGREDLAKARWSRLLELNPNLPFEVETMLKQQLAALGEAPPSSPAGAAAAAAPQGPTVQVNVSLGAGHSVPPNASLFIIARTAGGGPPVAVIRERASALPGQFMLSDANSMIPGRSLADFEELTLVARVSASGQPGAQPGDIQAERVFRPKDGGSVALVIDQVVQ